MSASERRKGAEGEREVVELLHAHGWPRAHRNFGSGSAGGGDVAQGPEGAVIAPRRTPRPAEGRPPGGGRGRRP